MDTLPFSQVPVSTGSEGDLANMSWIQGTVWDLQWKSNYRDGSSCVNVFAVPMSVQPAMQETRCNHSRHNAKHDR